MDPSQSIDFARDLAKVEAKVDDLAGTLKELKSDTKEDLSEIKQMEKDSRTALKADHEELQQRVRSLEFKAAWIAGALAVLTFLAPEIRHLLHISTPGPAPEASNLKIEGRDVFSVDHFIKAET